MKPQHEQIKRAPIGLVPKHIHDSKRIREITNAIYRYLESAEEIPIQWIDEYNNIVKNIKPTQEQKPCCPKCKQVGYNNRGWFHKLVPR